MNRSSIGWTDLTSNPIRYRDPAGNVVWGCERTSPGCAHCYAAELAVRYGRGAGAFTAEEMATYTPFLDEKEVHKILTAQTVGTRRVSGSRCFIGDMTDIFGEWVPDDLLDRLFAVMALRQDVTFQILTKRADRMRAYCATLGRHHETDRVSLAAKAIQPHGPGFMWQLGQGGWHLPNVWLGTSVENQHWAKERIPQLLQTPAAVRFIGMSSATCTCCPRWSSRWVDVHREVRPAFPMILMEGADKIVAPVGVHLARSNQHGALDVGGMGLVPADFTALPRLDWVIVGGESGQKARPVPVDAITSIVEQCRTAGVQAFVKQDCGSKQGLQGDIPDDIWAVKQFPAVPA